MSQHAIVIDVLGTGVDRDYTFNAFVVRPPTDNTENGMDGSGGTGKGGDGNGSGIRTGHSKHGFKTAVIVLGSAILLIFVLLGAFFIWRKKKNSVQRKCDCEKEAIQSGDNGETMQSVTGAPGASSNFLIR